MLYFDIQTLFWHSKSGQISYFDILNPILTFELGPNIVFWPSNWGRISYFHMQNPILTFKMGPNIVFWHKNQILTFKMGPNTVFWHSKSYSDIQNRAEYPILTLKIPFLHMKSGWMYHILTFKILLCHSNCCRISYFDIQNPILAFEMGPKSHYDIQNPILKFENEPNIVFWHSKSYLAFELRPNIVLWHSKSYFDIQNRAENCILTFWRTSYI